MRLQTPVLLVRRFDAAQGYAASGGTLRVSVLQETRRYQAVSLEAGRQAKEHGLDLIERHSDGFVQAARRYARTFASLNGTVTADDVRRWAEEHGMAPRHPNAWGAVFRGDFVHQGYTQSTITSNHARTIKVWRLRGEPKTHQPAPAASVAPRMASSTASRSPTPATDLFPDVGAGRRML